MLVGKCPWNEADGADCYKCAVKGVSICKYFKGIKYLDSVLCSYGGGMMDSRLVGSRCRGGSWDGVLVGA